MCQHYWLYHLLLHLSEGCVLVDLSTIALWTIIYTSVQLAGGKTSPSGGWYHFLYCRHLSGSAEKPYFCDISAECESRQVMSTIFVFTCDVNVWRKFKKIFALVDQNLVKVLV